MVISRVCIFKTNKWSLAFRLIQSYCTLMQQLFDLELPVYLLLCEDSNGQSEIVAVTLIVHEYVQCVTWMMETFRKFNAMWWCTRVLMADKDIQEWNVLKSCLPQAVVLTCLFHTLHSFRCEVTYEKMGITSGQRSLCLELIQKMAYAAMLEVDYNSL